jgi:hypothetical protein
LPFTGRDRIDDMLGDAKTFNELIVEHEYATRSNRTHRQLLVAGDAKLAHDKNVQRCTERTGHFIPDGHAAARQGQHEHVWAIGIGCEFLSKHPARVAAIAKESRLDKYWLHVSSSLVEAASAVFSTQSTERTVG